MSLNNLGREVKLNKKRMIKNGNEMDHSATGTYSPKIGHLRSSQSKGIKLEVLCESKEADHLFASCAADVYLYTCIYGKKLKINLPISF